MRKSHFPAFHMEKNYIYYTSWNTWTHGFGTNTDGLL